MKTQIQLIRHLVPFMVCLAAVTPKVYGQNAALLNGDPGIAAIANRAENAKLKQAIVQCLNGKIDEGLETVNEMVNSKNQDATFVLGKLIMAGFDKSRTPKNGLELLEKNADAGHALSILSVGQFKEKTEPALALNFYQQAAEEGEALAHLKLADIAEKGLLGTRPNAELALTHYRIASKSGNSIGDFHLARCVDKGIGTSPNTIESTRLYRKAAMAGVANANTIMAQRYFEGQGVEKDPVAAIGWLIRGVKAGSSEAMVLLGRQYESGLLIGQDINVAGQMYSSAAKLKDPQGKFRLALLYLNGIGTAADPVRAFVLLHDAQAIPEAKKIYDKLSEELSTEQLEFAQKKIEEAKK